MTEKDDELKRRYVDAFDQIPTPDGLFGKVVTMNAQSKRRTHVARKVAIAAAVLALTVLVSNTVVYAATGEGWIKRIVVSINGKENGLDFTKEGDYYTGTVNINDKDTLTIVTDDLEQVPNISIDMDEDGKVILREENEDGTFTERKPEEIDYSAVICMPTPLLKQE